MNHLSLSHTFSPCLSLSLSLSLVEDHGGLQETVELEGLSPVLFENSPSSSPCLQDAAGGEVEVFGTCAEEAVREMRFRIEQKTSLTASAGERDAVCSCSLEDTLD